MNQYNIRILMNGNASPQNKPIAQYEKPPSNEGIEKEFVNNAINRNA